MTAAPLVEGLLVALLAAQAAGDMPSVAPGQLEGRPPPGEASPLQARVDAAPAGATVEVGPGTYDGDLVIDRPLRLAGRGRPLLRGSGKGSVVRIRAAGVTVEGLDVDGRGGGDLGRDSSGIHVSAPGAVVRDNRIANALFGVYLREAPGARVEGNVVRGIRGKDPGEKGSGIHVWNTDGFTLVGNDIADCRDGLYIQSSPHGTIRGNSVRDLRYAIHFMYSDDNVFEDNLFERSDAGGVLMYSRRLVFRRNRFLHNRGFASVGLLLKACDDSLAEDNLLADNARGVFLEGSYRNLLRRNVVAESDTALVVYDSCGENRIEGNAFIANLTSLTLVGRRTDTVLDGNYWSDNDEPDLDGDGVSDRPFVLGSLFDHLRGNLTAADLLAQSLAAAALGVAERAFPVLAPAEVADRRPLARPPPLPAVPRPSPRPRRPDPFGLAGSLAALAAGGALLAGARPRRPAEAA
ncbi:nitrous oxide reductase family maturation protein NosD [Anaeromyxobacter terrae]|uniref:nitrous oxide reductase family maturation protein NosD n=1 Tax=Anaeromyxobacter terrae TaxID=2925406 RepID=UPI001F59C9EE|nr:nitrous oxide reductase family maturation protein NosD [Anaeromyxobacter sp. SG22]